MEDCKSPVRKMIRTRSSSSSSSSSTTCITPNNASSQASINLANISVKQEDKILKSTNNLTSGANEITNYVMQTKSNPQVSYRVLNLNPLPNKSSNTQSSAANSTTTAALSTINNNTNNKNKPQIIIMMSDNSNDNTNTSSNTVIKKQITTIIKNGETYASKNLIDQKRRMSHREIERRRRDKINDWIYALSREVPDCATDHTKQGNSKGGILAKTVKYIQDLRGENLTLRSEIERLKRRISDLEEDNLPTSYREETIN